jgi:hypothetical protein
LVNVGVVPGDEQARPQTSASAATAPSSQLSSDNEALPRRSAADLRRHDPTGGNTEPILHGYDPRHKASRGAAQ